MEQHQDKASVSKVYLKLLQENLVDPALTDEAHLFPPLKDLNTIPQPFSQHLAVAMAAIMLILVDLQLIQL